MSSKRLFYVLSALVASVLIASVLAVYFGSGYLTSRSDRLNKLKAEAGAIDAVQQSLASAKKDIEKYSEIEAITKQVVPQEKDQARTVREIVKIAADSNISIGSISFPTSTLGGAAKKSTTETSKSNSSQPTANTQTQKVEGLNNLERLEVTIQSDSSQAVIYSDFIEFLKNLELNRRTSQVSNVSIQPDTKNPNFLTFSLVLNVYIQK